MKNFFNTIFMALVPLLMAVAAVVMVVFGLVVAFYLLFWGLLIGAGVYAAIFFYHLLFGAKGRRIINKAKSAEKDDSQRKGRTFDYKDIK